MTKFYSDLQKKIEATYTEGVTVDEAEKLAAEFLHAQMVVSSELRQLDLDARMRKSGVKAIRSAVYLAEIKKHDKKPSDVQLSAIVDSDDIVDREQQDYDTAEANKAELERLYDIFLNAHIYFRGIAKGSFNG